MTLSDAALALFRCPDSMQPLRIASEEEAKAAFGEDESVEGALACEDGSRFYPIRDGLPVMLVSESKAPE